jgi:hypothetical protein
MMLSGLRWQKCASCPAKLLVLIESERLECIRCEQERKQAERRAKESRAWHEEKLGEAVRKGGRPKKYKTDSERRCAECRQNAERQRAFRRRVQRNEKPSRIFTETKELQAQKSPLSRYPLTPPHLARKTPPRGFGGESA